MYNFNQPVISDYNPFIRGGKKRSRKHKSRRNKKTKSRRTRRRYN
jgi:hypothetical protein